MTELRVKQGPNATRRQQERKKRYRWKKCGARIVAHFLVLLFAAFAHHYTR